ncbi:response regulator transcription factor [Pseudoroseicyclus aestuarii]|uniref:Response regulator receiver domain-containing protein n=1 Tax=Pseudoroseicyclus aestuarii TaxID=1795041 RepID=A0A318T199_9RHOB|nr:response regulator [Pseudoroseicyclus aestuarii]PYE85757.1 response regulator receiver domain-containing protein [Pseudoroseicyclus aestuarii]
MAPRVLLIEDEPNIVEALSFLLSRDGWTVQVYGDGAAAAERAAALRPDVVVLDVMLPNRSGYEVLRDLRAAAETRGIPVLMLTARGQAQDRERARDLGATDFMTKPFSNAEILARVRALAEGARP